MNNMTVFTSEKGKWWDCLGSYVSDNYSTILDRLHFERKCMKDMKLSLSKGSGDDIRYESISFKYKKRLYKIVNSGNQKYDFA